MRHARTIIASLFASSTLFLAGCRFTGAHSSTRAADPPASSHAVSCDKCKVTWVKVPVRGGKSRVVSYRSEKRMECPDCRSAARNFFATGQWQHTCKTCGDAVEICKAHE